MELVFQGVSSSPTKMATMKHIYLKMISNKLTITQSNLLVLASDAEGEASTDDNPEEDHCRCAYSEVC